MMQGDFDQRSVREVFRADLHVTFIDKNVISVELSKVCR